MGRYVENAPYYVWMDISSYHYIAQYFTIHGYGAISWERAIFYLIFYFLVSLYRPIFWKSRIWGDILRTPRIQFDFIFPRIIVSPNILPFTDVGRYFKNAPYSVWFYISSYHCIAQYFTIHRYSRYFENAPYSVWFHISSYHYIAQYSESHGYGAIF